MDNLSIYPQQTKIEILFSEKIQVFDRFFMSYTQIKTMTIKIIVLFMRGIEQIEEANFHYSFQDHQH